MRLSADRNDPGYHPNTEAFIVTLDGKPMLYAVTADEELGLVHIGQSCGHEVILRGDVKIVLVH